MTRRQHRQRRPEDGFTLIEIMITSALMLAVVAFVLPLVAGSLNTFADTRVRSDAVDNAQVALSQISHDVVSANIAYIDNSGTNPVVHLQSYGKSGVAGCIEYQVQYPAAGQPQIGALQRRIKNPGSGSAWPAGWTSIVTGVVNSTQTGTPVPLAIPASSQYQSLVVNLWVQVDTRNTRSAAPENYTSTFTGPAIPANAAATATPSSEPC